MDTTVMPFAAMYSKNGTYRASSRVPSTNPPPKTKIMQGRAPLTAGTASYRSR